jgi:hypothetical protein
MIDDINKLAESITRGDTYDWLRMYIADHRKQIVAELELFGGCEILMPDGRKMTIKKRRTE